MPSSNPTSPPTDAILRARALRLLGRREYARRELGERLMREVLDWADRHDVARVSLNSEPAARSLYERLGFAPGERYLELQLDRAVARPA